MRWAPAMISRTTICARPGTPAPSWSSASTDSEPAGAAALGPRSSPAGPSGPSVGELESEQAVLDHFGQCGMDPVLPGGDLIGSLPERHGLDERLDEHRCLMTDDMRPEQQSAVPVGDELDDARVVGHRPTIGHIRELLDLHRDLMTGVLRLLFAHTEVSDLRGGEHRAGDPMMIDRGQIRLLCGPRSAGGDIGG